MTILNSLAFALAILILGAIFLYFRRNRLKSSFSSIKDKFLKLGTSSEQEDATQIAALEQEMTKLDKELRDGRLRSLIPQNKRNEVLDKLEQIQGELKSKSAKATKGIPENDKMESNPTSFPDEPDSPDISNDLVKAKENNDEKADSTDVPSEGFQTDDGPEEKEEAGVPVEDSPPPKATPLKGRVVVPPMPKPKDPIINDEQQQATSKKIGYQPVLNFQQNTSPKYFPIVKMPPSGSLVKYPSLGRRKAKGISEDGFHRELLAFFKAGIKRNFSLKFEGAKYDYEPDFTFLHQDCNLFVDIEIDEPYSGNSRKPMHFEGSYDIDRDEYFNKNGWVVIRFAEEQVVRHPQACCQYVGRVLNALIPTFNFEEGMELPTVKQWTYEEAQQMAKDKYRESYLGVEFEPVIEEAEIEEAEIDTDAGQLNPQENTPAVKSFRDTITYSEQEEEFRAVLSDIQNGAGYATIDCDGYRTLIRIDSVKKDRTIWMLKAYDWISNQDSEFNINRIRDVKAVNEPFLFEGQGISANEFREQVELANDNQLYVQLRYRKYGGEVSVRTISHFQRDMVPTAEQWWYSSELHMRAYCNLKREERNFKFERILEMRVLNFCYD
jgi:hypothetical protein